MTSFGVLPTGFVEKTLQNVLTEIEDAEKAAFGAGTDVAVDAPLGQLNGIFADQIAQLWELSGAIYRALYPDSAEDESLDNVAAITGAVRLPPSATTVTLSLNLDAGTVVPLGSVVSNSVTGDRFATDAAVLNAGADPTNVVAQATVEVTGPINVDAFAIDQIETPVAGWTAQAAVDSGNAAPFVLVFNDTLTIKIDSGVLQTLIFIATAAVADSGNSETYSLSDGDTLTVDIDNGGVDTATFNAGAASLENANAETYALVDGQTLLVSVDGGGVQTATFNTADFVTIGAATAEEVRDVINTDVSGQISTASSAGTKVTITSSKKGTDSAIQVTGGTANAVLGFSTVEVFGSGDFADISVATAAEVAAVIEADIAGAATIAVGGIVRITSDSLGTASEVDVTGGAANVALGFSVGPINGTQDFPAFGAVTALQMATVISAKLTGGTALDLTTGIVRIESDTDGPGSAVEVTGGAANVALAFPTVKVAGMNQTGENKLGSDLESNTAFRLRREQLLSEQGDATVEAILAQVRVVTGVLEARVFENTTDVINVDGMPPHSIEAVVDAPGVTDTAIAQAVFDSKAAGIEAHGTTISEVITDSQGVDHTIKATRAALIDIHIAITVTTNTVLTEGPIYPVDGDTQVAAALVAAGDLLGIADDVIAERIKSAAFTIDGVTDITVFFIDKTPVPVVSVNIPIGSRELSDFDLSRVTVTS